MPYRPFSREQTWLFPPTLDDLVPEDHPARFVATFVDVLERSDWRQLGVDPKGEALGAPEYHPRALLGVWVYGFMTGVRSSRKLEGACRDQLPYLWLTGWQHPDHNTLWRFYQEHRQAMRSLLKRTVRTAVSMGLIDLAVQAVDGTKVGGNAAKKRTYDAAGLQKLLEKTEAAILDLEAQNVGGEDPVPPKLPQALKRAGRLREQVRLALERLAQEEGRARINLTDGDAGLMKSRQGIVAGYNAQAVVSPLAADVAQVTGLLITAAEVVTDPEDHEQLVPMLEQAEEMTGKRAEVSLADGGFHSGANLAACAERGQQVLMPESQEQALKQPYHKERFSHDAATDTYICPQGQRLRFVGIKQRTRAAAPVRIYRGSGAICRRCPAFGQCTKDRRQGRALEIGPYEALLRSHRRLMATDEAKARYRQRQEVVEPVFGILKDQQGGRRFLLRGVVQVAAEWRLLATAFNLRTLWRVWKARKGSKPWEPRILAGAIGT